MTQPQPEMIETQVDLPTYQGQLKRMIGDQFAELIMDRAMMASQIEVLHRELAKSRQETVEALMQARDDEADLPQGPPAGDVVDVRDGR